MYFLDDYFWCYYNLNIQKCNNNESFKVKENKNIENIYKFLYFRNFLYKIYTPLSISKEIIKERLKTINHYLFPYVLEDFYSLELKSPTRTWFFFKRRLIIKYWITFFSFLITLIIIFLGIAIQQFLKLKYFFVDSFYVTKYNNLFGSFWYFLGYFFDSGYFLFLLIILKIFIFFHIYHTYLSVRNDYLRKKKFFNIILFFPLICYIFFIKYITIYKLSFLGISQIINLYKLYPFIFIFIEYL